MLMNDLKIHNIDVYEVNNVYTFKDKVLENKWVLYHDSVAVFRLLCNKCNSSLGSYGYKR